MSTNGSSQCGPEWLNRKFIEDILSREQGVPVKVRQLRVANAVGKGENYASLLLRVGADVDLEGAAEETPKTVSLIVKCFPLGELMQQFIRESGAFDREAKMYFSTIPAMQALLEENIPGEKVIFAPSALHCEREHTIVLPDLRDQSYRMTDRHSGVDLKHATMVLRNLAKFHAASVALRARDPEHVESYTDIFYKPEKREQIEQFVPQTLESVAKVMDTWDKENPKFAGYAEKMRSFAKTAVDQVIEAVKPSKSFLNVLNHGDCWVNNSMYRYDDETGDLVDMRFIDFQIARYGSPTLDLQYFLYTSVQPDVREHNWRALLETYVEQLRETLTALGHGDKAVSVDDLQADMDARAAFGLVSSCTVLCAVVADPGDAIRLEDLTKEDLEKGEVKIFDKALAGTRFNSALKRLLPLFVQNGAL